MDTSTEWLLVWSSASLIAGWIFTLWVRARNRAVVGSVIQRGRLDRSLFQHLTLALVALVAILLFVSGTADVPAWTALAGAACLTLVTPADQDAVCGVDGVQRGWYGRRLEDLEEWRLVGDHLRFRLFGEWTSVDLPASEHPAMRTRLERAAADRESGFKA